MSKKDAKAQAAAAKAYQKSQSSWFARHKILTGLGAFIALIVVISVASSGGGGDDTVDTAGSGDTTTDAPKEDATDAPKEDATDAPKEDAPKAEAPKPQYAGALKDDQVASAPGAEIRLSGWTVTAAALKPTQNPFGTNLCSGRQPD